MSELQNVLVFGLQDSDKETILNLLSDEGFEISRSSTKPDTLPCSPFMVVDLPELDQGGQGDHVKVQQALREHHFKAICVTCNIGDSNDDVVNQLTKIAYHFQHHMSNVVLVFTQADDISRSRTDELRLIALDAFKISQAFFLSNNTSGGELSRWLGMWVNPTKETFTAPWYPTDLFQPVPVGQGIFEGGVSPISPMGQVLSARKNAFKEFQTIYDQMLTVFNGTQDYELHRALYSSLKQHANRLISSYTEEASPHSCNKYDLSVELIALKNEITPLLEGFKRLVSQNLPIETTVYSNDTGRYKQCSCGLIWLRVYGCDSVVCGKRSISKDWSNTAFWNFNIEWSDGQVAWKKSASTKQQTSFQDSEVSGLTAQEQQMNMQRNAQGKATIAPLGCGKTWRWAEMPDVTDQVIQRLRSEWA